MRRERRAWLDSLSVARSVLELPSARERWDAPSALSGWTIGGLSAHIIRGASLLTGYLDADVPDAAEVITPAEYWRRIPADATQPIHVGIRERGQQQAERGIDALLAELDDAQRQLAAAFQTVPDGRLIAAFAGLVLTLDDFLICRCVELTVHTDDLCVSLAIDTATMPVDALELSIDCLVGAARLRHGDVAVLRALTRRERDGVAALRVL
ncbi:MAG: maleylpyruvate isomerase N-terminal domain-containing protein [Candidatus Dormibacteria bacterium]